MGRKEQDGEWGGSVVGLKEPTVKTHKFKNSQRVWEFKFSFRFLLNSIFFTWCNKFTNVRPGEKGLFLAI